MTYKDIAEKFGIHTWNSKLRGANLCDICNGDNIEKVYEAINHCKLGSYTRKLWGHPDCLRKEELVW